MKSMLLSGPAMTEQKGISAEVKIPGWGFCWFGFEEESNCHPRPDGVLSCKA